MKIYVETKTIKDKDSEYIVVLGFRRRMPLAPRSGREILTTYVEENISHSEQRAYACEQVAVLKGNENVLIFANYPY